MSQKTLVPLSPLDSVSFKTVWEKEDYFTEWLIEPDNLQILSDTVGIKISEPEIQDKIGTFRADIVAIDENNNKIIIENQRNETNHDHLGKALTYAAGKAANTVIWITEKTTEEHRAAIEWLNQNTNENIAFFLLELKLWKIGNSNPAIQFDIIEQPNNWVKKISNNNQRDYTKYSFNGDGEYPKNHTVLKIIQETSNRYKTFDELKECFKEVLDLNKFVIEDISQVKDVSRYFREPEQLIMLNDKNYYLSNQWGKSELFDRLLK